MRWCEVCKAQLRVGNTGTRCAVCANKNVSLPAPEEYGEIIVKEVQLHRIKESPLNPRRVFNPDALAELARSVKDIGVKVPLLVRHHDKKYYEIITGARRHRAAKMAGLATVPVIIASDVTDDECRQLMLVENIQREELTAFDEGRYYKELIETHKYTPNRIVSMIGKSLSHVYARLKIAGLTDVQVEKIQEAGLTASHAVILARHPEKIEHAVKQQGSERELRRSIGLLQKKRLCWKCGAEQ